MNEQKIRKVITRFVELYKEDPDRWDNERYSHYDFFRLLFDYFEPKFNKSKNGFTLSRFIFIVNCITS